jgi:hypothetical protein
MVKSLEQLATKEKDKEKKKKKSKLKIFLFISKPDLSLFEFHAKNIQKLNRRVIKTYRLPMAKEL